ncbi:NfeD family protein [Nodosilinea sp. LEGE 07298]|jgi:membrane protein implicated in regulation of membrane protease activity|uniref:NfeD family protein n=1 Tax=Nodosilinea sp. LEGE 07298 TaxID=2777970 RepID=UPI0018812E9F|nr:NfeD family protein [Nodosilinea sp. LEGE 07298]MBE9108837.1 NfeD family protein [Nodosilinea sp. LEGE 07298]
MNLTHTLELFDHPKAARVDCPISAQLEGRVYYQGTYWPARVYEGVIDAGTALAPSSWVTVVGRYGLTLLIVPPLAAA